MSTSQAGTGPTNIDSPIKLAQFLDNVIQGVYDLEIVKPFTLGLTGAGMRVVAREVMDKRRKRYQNVTLLITDWISSSDPVTLSSAYPFTFDNSKQLEASLYDSLGNALISQTTAPTSAQRGLLTRQVPRTASSDMTVSLAAGTNTVSLPAFVSTSSGQTSSGGAGTATIIFNASWRLAIMENIGTGDVDVGPSSVTFGAGFRLKAGVTNPVFFGSGGQASAAVGLYCIDNAITPGNVTWAILA